MNNLLNSSKLFVKRNASTILTCIGGAGVIATTVSAVKATPKALELIDQAEEVKGEELTKVETVQVTWPVYIPTLVYGATTLACIFGANMLSQKGQASLMSAYALIDNSYKEYKKKVEELYGEDADGEIRGSIANDKYKAADIPEGDGKELFFDEFSGRFFRSTIEEVQRAEYEINRDIFMRSWATINDFYDYLKIPFIDGGDEIGWSPDMNEYEYWQAWVDFSNLKMVADDGTEYYILRIYQEPRMSFADF